MQTTHREGKEKLIVFLSKERKTKLPYFKRDPHTHTHIPTHTHTHTPPPTPGGSDGKASACNAGNAGSIPGLGRSSGEGT